MNDQEEHPLPTVKPGEPEEEKRTSLARTLISLALFIGLDYWLFGSWLAVAILVTVIFIHELGHFLMMKRFGYKAVNMTFVPFVGAYVSGTATDLSRKNKIYVLLAGPLPGIVIGCVLLYCAYHLQDPLYQKIAMPFLLLNLFNLLPIIPLDGGQFFQTLFFSGSRYIQLAFLYVSLVLILFGSLQFRGMWPLLFVAVLLLFRITSAHRNIRIQKKLDAAGIDYACSYDDLTDEEYYQIRRIVIADKPGLAKKYDAEVLSANEQPLIAHIEAVLLPAYTNDLSALQKFIFILTWLIAFLLPILQWMYYHELLNSTSSFFAVTHFF